MKQENRTVFIANDGKVFTSSCECMDYERRITLEGWKAVPKVEVDCEILDGGYEENYVIVCRNIDDVNRVNAYLNYLNGCADICFVSTEDIGRRVLINLWSERQGASRIKGYAEDMVKRVVRELLMDEPRVGIE